MQLDLDVAGHLVVIFGRYPAAHRVVRRFAAAGARVTAVMDGELPLTGPRPETVRFVPCPEPDDQAGLLRLIGPAWLVVIVESDSAQSARTRRMAAQLRIVVTTERPAAESGTVTLVGGGPGLTPLLTVAACDALRDADVVFYDRLAPTDDLARLAPGAELVDVGKTPYHHQTSQGRIEDLMTERALSGQSVVRLKGGDPFVFGRGGEELLACAAAGVTTRVVPGVSSAIAVPAAAGIPVTHRGISHAFTVISGHVPPRTEELLALVQLGGTIVILMGVANLTLIVSGLRQAGLGDSMPAAVIERGFSDSQRTTVTTVDRLAFDARRLGVASPAVVVIGEVARLGDQLADSLPLMEMRPGHPESFRSAS
ncbi:MAG TPA: uroporphyrinogen-III C-methyltransferase [Microlunatus sp.]